MCDHVQRFRRNAVWLLLDNGDARNRVNFIPFGVEGVLHVSSHDANARTNFGKLDIVVIALTRSLGILLGHLTGQHLGNVLRLLNFLFLSV